MRIIISPINKTLDQCDKEIKIYGNNGYYLLPTTCLRGYMDILPTYMYTYIYICMYMYLYMCIHGCYLYLDNGGNGGYNYSTFTGYDI